MPPQHLQSLPGHLKRSLPLTKQKGIGKSSHLLVAGVSAHEHGGDFKVLLDVDFAERVDRSAQEAVVELVSESFVHGFEEAEAVGDDIQQKSAAGVFLHFVAQASLASVLIAFHEEAQLLQSSVLFQTSRETRFAWSSSLDDLRLVFAMVGERLLEKGLSGSLLPFLLLPIQFFNVLVCLCHKITQLVLAVHNL